MKFFLYFCAFIVLSIVFLYFGVGCDYEGAKDYAGFLMSVAGAVFTVMGIWVALLYPSALSKIVDEKKVLLADFSEAKNDTRRLEFLIGSILGSAFVVLIVLFLFLIRLVFIKIGFFVPYHTWFSSIALSCLVVISLVQAEAVFHVMMANILFINDLHKKRVDREVDADL
ncbi:hypothetical protein [Chromobacterium sp. IRSSSOUMB001]|uniref:hypothetical protein n=1 Tax=Chromobacterium sp. IRSSSOUMB001 TaxID=2927123 RepID=UPI0020C08E0E|nr:hypothetical protein [Chromobacterium sp. IRSSSOUMB001]